MISRLRKITKIKKIGHAGTLDPLATGLLIVAIGREATREIAKYVGMDKIYIATIRLGAESDTYDAEGKIISRAEQANLDRKVIQAAIASFIGEQQQIPPMFSAKKFQGKKLYELAREGKVIPRKPSIVSIYDVKIINYTWPDLEILVHCSSGTYIRSLAHDLGEKLNIGGYLTALKRTKIGEFSLDQAIKINNIDSVNWRSFLFFN